MRVCENYTNLNIRTDLLGVMAQIVEKLGSENVEVRLMTHRALRNIDHQVKSKNVVTLFLNYLTDPSWHIREESILHLIFHFMK